MPDPSDRVSDERLREIAGLSLAESPDVAEYGRVALDLLAARARIAATLDALGDRCTARCQHNPAMPAAGYVCVTHKLRAILTGDTPPREPPA